MERVDGESKRVENTHEKDGRAAKETDVDVRVDRAARDSGAFKPTDDHVPPPVKSLKQSLEELPVLNQETLIPFLKQHPLALQYAPEEFRKDKECILAAFYEDPKSMEFAIFDDDQCLLDFLDIYGEAFDYLHEKYHNSMAIIKYYMSYNVYSLQYMKLSKDTVNQLVKENPALLAFFSDEFKYDIDLIKLVYDSSPNLLLEMDEEAQTQFVTKYPRAINKVNRDVVKKFMQSKEHVTCWLEALPVSRRKARTHRRNEVLSMVPVQFFEDKKIVDLISHKVPTFLPCLPFIALVPLCLLDSAQAETVKQFSGKFTGDQTMPSEWFDSLEHMKIAVLFDPSVFEKCSASLRSNPIICQCVATKWPENISKLPIDFQLKFLHEHPECVAKAYAPATLPDLMLDIKEIVLPLLKVNPELYFRLSSPLKDDNEIKRAAAQIAKVFRGFDEEFQLTLIMEDPKTVKYSVWGFRRLIFPDPCYENPQVVVEILRNFPNLYIEKQGYEKLESVRRKIYTEPLWINALQPSDQVILLREQSSLCKKVTDPASLFKFLEEKWPEMKEDVLCILELHPVAIAHVSKDILADRVFLAECAKRCPFIITEMPDSPDVAFLAGCLARIHNRSLIDDVAVRVFLMGFLFDYLDPNQARVGSIIEKKACSTRQLHAIAQMVETRRELVPSLDIILKDIPLHFYPLCAQILMMARSIEIFQKLTPCLSVISGKKRALFRNSGSGFHAQLYRLINNLRNLEPKDFEVYFARIMSKIDTLSHTEVVEFLDLVNFILLDEAALAQKKALDVICGEGDPVDLVNEKIERLFGDDRDMYQSLIKYRRVFSAILGYAAKNRADPSMLEIIRAFIISAMRGTFTKDRMEPKGNPNLQKLIAVAPECYEAWANLHGRQYENEGFIVTVSGDWQDQFCAGMDVVNSCQDPTEYADGTARGLMGYCMDGRDHLLVIHDSDGKMLARASLRFGFIEDKPALFLAQPFGRGAATAQTCKLSLLKAAQQVSEELGVPLYDHARKKYGEALPKAPEATFLKGSAPYVYDDMTHHIHEGEFKVEHPREVWDF